MTEFLKEMPIELIEEEVEERRWEKVAFEAQKSLLQLPLDRSKPLRSRTVLEAAVPLLEKSHWDELVEERASLGLCGYVLCPNRIRRGALLQHVQYCCDGCTKKAFWVRDQILDAPLRLRQVDRSERRPFSLLGERVEEKEEVEETNDVPYGGDVVENTSPQAPKAPKSNADATWIEGFSSGAIFPRVLRPPEKKRSLERVEKFEGVEKSSSPKKKSLERVEKSSSPKKKSEEKPLKKVVKRRPKQKSNRHRPPATIDEILSQSEQIANKRLASKQPLSPSIRPSPTPSKSTPPKGGEQEKIISTPSKPRTKKPKSSIPKPPPPPQKIEETLEEETADDIDEVVFGVNGGNEPSPLSLFSSVAHHGIFYGGEPSSSSSSFKKDVSFEGEPSSSSSLKKDISFEGGPSSPSSSSPKKDISYGGEPSSSSSSKKDVSYGGEPPSPSSSSPKKDISYGGEPSSSSSSRKPFGFGIIAAAPSPAELAAIMSEETGMYRGEVTEEEDGRFREETAAREKSLLEHGKSEDFWSTSSHKEEDISGEYLPDPKVFGIVSVFERCMMLLTTWVGPATRVLFLQPKKGFAARGPVDFPMSGPNVALHRHLEDCLFTQTRNLAEHNLNRAGNKAVVGTAREILLSLGISPSPCPLPVTPDLEAVLGLALLWCALALGRHRAKWTIELGVAPTIPHGCKHDDPTCTILDNFTIATPQERQAWATAVKNTSISLPNFLALCRMITNQ